MAAVRRSVRGSDTSLEREFTAEPASVSLARHFVTTTASNEDAEINLRLSTLTSELVSNAILHAQTSFVVGVDRDTDRIRVSVSDGSPAVPTKKSNDPNQPTGRGLHIVEALSDRWGVTPTESGKTVWFEVSAADSDL